MSFDLALCGSQLREERPEAPSLSGIRILLSDPLEEGAPLSL
jgi:hypothetical protein